MAGLSEGPGDQPLAVPIAVGVCGVDEGRSQLQRTDEGPDREPVVGLAPPSLADPPGPKADLRYVNTGASQSAMVHERCLLLPRTEIGIVIARSETPRLSLRD